MTVFRILKLDEDKKIYLYKGKIFLNYKYYNSPAIRDKYPSLNKITTYFTEDLIIYYEVHMSPEDYIKFKLLEL